MTEEREWEQWEQEWHREPSGALMPATPASVIAAVRRHVFIARLIEGVVATGALGITALALEHPVNAFEAALGLVVGAAIGIVWIRRVLIRRNEDSAATTSSVEHLALIEQVRHQQRRLAHFLWLVIALELAFLTPWWMIGSQRHPRTFTDLTSWEAVWLPILGMLGVLVWSIRLNWRADDELRSISRVRERNGGEL
jgi:hypothetical protein